MKSVSSRWAEAVGQGLPLVTRFTMLEGGVEGDVLDSVSDGTVTLDGQASIRGRCDLTVRDLDLIPSGPGDLLSPYGNEVKVERGIRYLDGTEELVPLGVYRIEDAEVDDTGGDLPISIPAYDRSKRISDAKFEEPYEIASGTNFATAIEDTIKLTYPDVVSSLAETELTTPPIRAEEGEDRWEFCRGLAKAIGMELYFNGEGELVLAPYVTGEVVATLAEGPGGVLKGVRRRMTRENARNKIIATGENTGNAAPVRAEALDDNPASPTYYYGDFGQVPDWYTSPHIAADEQAQDAAEAVLAKRLGVTQSVDFRSLVNPALEPGDTVRITRERAGVDEDHVLDQVVIALTAEGEMSGQTRETQVVQ